LESLWSCGLKEYHHIFKNLVCFYVAFVMKQCHCQMLDNNDNHEAANQFPSIAICQLKEAYLGMTAQLPSTSETPYQLPLSFCDESMLRPIPWLSL
jgi:hypothetical protein